MQAQNTKRAAVRILVAVVAMVIVHVGLLAPPTGALPQREFTVRSPQCVYVEITYPTYFFAAVCPPPLH